MEILTFFLLILINILIPKVSSQCTRDLISDCVIYDSTHIKTFDGKVYSFSSTCSYTLVSIPAKGLIINYLRNPNALEIIYHSKTYMVSVDNYGSISFTINGFPYQIPTTDSGIKISQPGSMAILALQPFKMKIRYNGNTLEIIQNNKNNFDSTNGLCGNNDGCNYNELTMSDGSSTTSSLAWANSWGLNGCLSNNFLNHCGTSPILIHNSEIFCHNLFQRPEFAGCADFEESYRNICRSEYCACSNPIREECMCDMLDSMVRSCQTKNNNLINWRSPGLCEITCQNVFQYMTCAPNHKQLICGESPRNNRERFDCEEGCYCPEGMRWYQGVCYWPSECP
nr:SCO-spondin-like [Onthophagus taurus]